jgi:hydrogenase-4 component E
MHPTGGPGAVLGGLNDLIAGMFLLLALGIVATRQIQAVLKIWIAQALCLAASAFLLAAHYRSGDLLAVGVINVVTKLFLIPWLLRRYLSSELYTLREINQSINVSMSLLLSLALIGFGFAVAHGLLRDAPPDRFASSNLPIGIAGLLLGAYTVSVRREALAQMLGLLAMENAAFFAGVALVPDLPLIAELAAALDLLVIALVLGVLTRAIHEHVGSTEVAEMARLREGGHAR